MTTLLVVLPVLGLLTSFVRPVLSVTLVGSMGVAALVSSVNLVHVVLNGSIKRVVLVDGFLRVGAPDTGVISLGVHLDFYSAYTVWVVFVVSFLVHLYSTSYMGGDPRVGLFLVYLTLFTFFMVVLLVSVNYVQLFLGWEGVGLTSYLLVNFWTTRTAANKSALKALLVNRVGDVFLLYGVFAVVTSGSVEFVGGSQVHPVVGPLLVGAAAAKSAQLGLHTWLPDAMEGPTPVSALIHAATMVTAGVFLLYRAGDLIDHVRPGVTVLGGMTALFAGSVALFQYDLKRVIAYSTCSQLGYMVVAVGVAVPELSAYHLANHAFFKALLFLGAGVVIHGLADEQDVRRMGGLVGVFPVTYASFVVGSLALGGFPFLSGFYSKDSILEVLYAKGYWFTYFACLVAAYLTAYYSFRTLYLVFGGSPRGTRSVYLGATEGDSRSVGVLVVLVGLSLVHGYVVRDRFVGLGGPLGWTTPLVEAEFATPGWVKLVPLVLSGVAAVGVVQVETTLRYAPTRVVWFFSKRWWWDHVDAAGSRRLLLKGYALYRDLERGVFERVGPGGVVLLVGRGYDAVRGRGWLSLFWVALVVGFVTVGVVAAGSGAEVLPPIGGDNTST